MVPFRSEESFQQYFSEMPWLAVPYSDEARRSRLNRLYGIQGNHSQLILFNVVSILQTGRSMRRLKKKKKRCFSASPVNYVRNAWNTVNTAPLLHFKPT